MNHEAAMEFLKLAKSIVKTETGEVSEDSLPELLIEIAQKYARPWMERASRGFQSQAIDDSWYRAY